MNRETPDDVRSRTNLVVVDASLAVKWILNEVWHHKALALLTQWEQQSVVRIAPSWFSCEVAIVLYKRVLRGDLSLAGAQLGIQSIHLAITLRDAEPATSIRALELAIALGRSATYDAHYLALAERERCELWTADERFWNAARMTFRWIRWVGEASAPSSALRG
jgi:predicted nucleic acid-binding protein